MQLEIWPPWCWLVWSVSWALKWSCLPLSPIVSGCLPLCGGWVLVGVAAFLGSEVVLSPVVSGCLPSCVGVAASRTKIFRNQNHRFQSKFAYCKLFGVYAGVIFRLAEVSYSFGLSSAFLRKLVRFVWWPQNRPALSFFKPCPPEEKCPLTNCLRFVKSSICEPCEMLLGFPGTSNPCVSCKNMWRFATFLILILATFRNAAIHCVRSG